MAPPAPTGPSLYAQDGSKFASCGAKPIYQSLPPGPMLLAAMQRPALGTTLWHLPAGDSWRPLDGSFVAGFNARLIGKGFVLHMPG